MKPDTHPDLALVPYLRGELSQAERESVALHLDGCARCRAELDAFAAVLERVASGIGDLPAPDWIAYRSELRRKLEGRGTRRHRLWLAGWASLAAAGVAAALVLAMRPSSRKAVPMEELAMEQQLGSNDLGLLENYPVVERLDLLENYDVIEHLDQLPPPEEPHDSQS